MKLNTHYIVTKGNPEGTILKGDRLTITYHKNKDKYSTLGEYTMILPPRETQRPFFGMPALNSCIYFQTKEAVSDAMKGIEVEYDTKLAQEIIDDLQHKINKIKVNHKL